MKNRMTISMILALMMIASTFVVGAGNVNSPCGGGDPVEPGVGLEVDKSVWDGECWTDPITAEIGDDVRFNITVSYYPVDTDPDDGDGVGYKAKELVVNDTLPDCLEYNNSLVIKHGNDVYTTDHAIFEGDSIYWYITRDYGLCLWDRPVDGPRTLYLEFNATVVSSGENVNLVNVTGFETCGQEDLYGEATATVNVDEPGCPAIDVEKKYWDEDLEKWEDGPVTLYEGDEILFYVNISNIGNVPLHNVIGIDVAPDFFDIGGTHTSNIGTLNPGEYYYDEFTATVLDIDEVLTDENYVNATADEDVYDEDAVEVTVKPHFIFEKKVWNGTAWADSLGQVQKSTKVKFKLTATYYGDEDQPMKCLVIADDLPFCLEYADNEKIWFSGDQITDESSLWPDIYIGDDEETVDVCGQQVVIPGGVIVWDWRQKNIFIEDGDSVVIEFETSVTEYCEDCDCCQCCWDQNCALGIIWGCMQCTLCQGYHGYDCVDIKCCPPPTTFTKKVLDGETWEDSIETVVGSTLTFKLELNYYGEENLTDVNFKDILPCVLEYDNNAEINVVGGNAVLDQEPEISSDGKTLWWNLTEVNLTDGGKITILFDARVNGTTGSPCDQCEPCECINYAEVRAYNRCPPDLVEGFPMDDKVDIVAEGNCKPSRPDIRGPETGETGQQLTFYFVSTDENNDQIRYTIDWGDSSPYTVSVLHDSDEEISLKHTYDEPGTYKIKAKATDEHGATHGFTPAGYEFKVEITEEPSEGLEIIAPGFINIKTIDAGVKNKGTNPVNDVDWNFTIYKKGLFGNIKWIVDSNGTISEIGAGKTKSITSDEVKLKFGLATIEIDATSGALEDTLSKKAFVVGSIIIVL